MARKCRGFLFLTYAELVHARDKNKSPDSHQRRLAGLFLWAVNPRESRGTQPAYAEGFGGRREA